MSRIGAKDGIDRALVRQYANAQTSNFDDTKMNADEVWEKMNLLAMGQRAQINFISSLRKVS